MANRLQFKRGTTTPGTIFYEGEPIYDKSGKVLYVGDDGGTGTGAGSVVASASAYSAVAEILNQATASGAGSIKLYEDTDNGTNFVSVSAAALIGSNYTLTLPNGTGSADQVLKTDGSGNLDWVDQTSGFSGFDITDGVTSETIASGNAITFTGGDGITAAVSATDTLTISADLKANGGLVIESTEIAVDLGASSITGTLAIADGGTGASSASDARTNLGVDAAGTDNSTDVTLVTTTADYLSIVGQAITLNQIDLAADVTGDLPVADGGTGASSASDARTNLGVDAAGTDNSTDVTLAGSLDYITISGQTITRNAIDLAADVTGDLPVADGGTGASSASDARTNLGVDAAGTDNSTDVTLAGSLDYITISGQTITRNAIDLAADVTGTLPAASVGDGITNDQLAGSIANSKLLNDSVSFGGVSLDLGQSDATPAFDLSDATNYPTSSLSGNITNAQLSNSSITVTDGSTSTATALGETITFSGTANEVEVAESSGTITVGLPDDVTITNDLTVNGNLNVIGTAVTFSVETTHVEDRVFELGLVNGDAPSSATTWDLGVAFNYNSSGAKKSGLVWLNNQFMAMLSQLSESSDSGNADPQITATAYAPVAADSLYLGGIASGNEVINSSQEAVNLIFDGGSY